jgi:GntR family transcriptional regulator/MocR family aminotransferase
MGAVNRSKPSGTDFLLLSAPTHGIADWLTSALRDAVADGRLPVDARLPATRALAAQLGVSRGVVVEAYQRLADEGLVAGRRGGGTTVLARSEAPPRSVTAPVNRQPEFDLSPGIPDLSAFPRQAWLRAEKAALGDLSPAELGYGDPRGTPALREALSVWLARTRGVRADPGDLIVVNGVAQGLSLLTAALRERGTTALAFEDPGSRGTREQIVRWGLTTVPVPVDEHGLDVDALAVTGLDAVVVTPAHQFPTGVVLSAPRRRALAVWARATGGLIVEDDYDAEHRYDRAPVAAVHGLAPDHVAYVGSVSKTLAPALRLGWLLAPPRLRADVLERKRWSDITSPAFGQLALAHMITSGGFDKHLRLVRARQRARRDALLDALRRHLPTARVQGIAAGLHLLVTLPDVDDDVVLAKRARAADVRVHPLSRHRLGDGPAGLVIGYAANTPDRLHEAVRRIASVI